MRLNWDTIREIIGGSRRFVSPDGEGMASYTILDEEPLKEDFDEEIIRRYYERLRYAVLHAEELIDSVFEDSFYDAYFVNRDMVGSPAQMRAGLLFDSFVLYRDHRTIGACLTDPRCSPGHFIDAAWDGEWQRISVWIC